MATNSVHPTTDVDLDDEPERRESTGGVGMHHVTVVPTNFEREPTREE
ncbi:hypothetical protein [Haloarchaeobius amylolyticus]|nr:hypothetical protein [Haloarchaeobius amylolyticus]